MNDESTDYLEGKQETSLLDAIKRADSERKELKKSVDRESKVFQKYQHESIRYAPLYITSIALDAVRIGVAWDFASLSARFWRQWNRAIQALRLKRRSLACLWRYSC